MTDEAPFNTPEQADGLAEEAEAAVAAAVAANEAAAVPDPNAPIDRDIIIGEGADDHRTNQLLSDIIRLHRILWKLHDKETPQSGDEIEAMVDHIIQLMKEGRQFELAGLKDVPRPFMRSNGRFVKRDAATNQWMVADDEETKTAITDLVLSQFGLDDLGDLTESPYKDLKAWLSKKVEPKVSPEFMPEGRDAILLKCAETFGEKMFETQGGNKTVFNLASNLVTSFTNSPDKRVEAALSIMNGLDELDVEGDGDKASELTTTKHSRFLIRSQRDDLSVTWDIMDPASAAEFTVIWVFEVYLEKEEPNRNATVNFLANPAEFPEVTPPGKDPIKDPTEDDVLFGRGGMTNSHPGNRRFRDIIALHRPDYIRAIKMDKPAVARKIVRAFRHGSPPGRFLKKGDDGDWYDVGDRMAAEKTSQGLRERSNAEKRQRSALREALRIRKEDMAEEVMMAQKKARLGETRSPDLNIIPTLNYVGTTLPIPLSLGMKDTTTIKNTVVRKKTSKDGKIVEAEFNTEGLPPNAVDDEGNILVTDYDILCGRGGLTNHHKGNKRFRDIVSLHRSDYVRAPKIQKPSVARVIVQAIRRGDPPGRFIRKDEKTGKWIDIGDKKAAEKTSQALREKTNEEREKFKNSPAPTGILLPSPSVYIGAGLFPGLVPPNLGGEPVKTDGDTKEEAVEAEGQEEEGKAAEEKEEDDTVPGAADDEVTDKVAQEAAEALMEV